jgi:hypothetical protein
MTILSRNTSGYRGVSWNKTLGKWWARITVNGKRVHLGYFDDVNEAGRVCKEFAIKNNLEGYLRPNMSDLEYNRYYYAKNIEKMREKKRIYRSKNAEEIRKRDREHYKLNKDVKHEYVKICHTKLKKEVFAAYGGKCECCGEDNEYFLTMDHINNDGYKYRKSANNSNVYKYIKRNCFPDTFRILCWNCNCGRSKTPSKLCPHEIERNRLLCQHQQ